ncbi:asparagine synthase (glutamine-hydrolyzing) [Embleya sp. AB8]
MKQGAERLAVFGPCSATDLDMLHALASDDLGAAVRVWAGSFVAVRARNVGLVEVVTDASGAAPVYTVSTSGGVVWGSSARALAFLSTGDVDTDWLAAYLRDRSAPLVRRTAWKGVHPVPAGSILTLRSGADASLAQWWSPPQQSPREAAFALRCALTDGIRVRVEGVVATSDLAGMDSTTVTLLAARYGPITGITLHPAGAEDGGDMRYARLLTGPHLRRTCLPLARRHLPFASGEFPLPATDEPAPSTPSWALFSGQMEAVAHAGTEAHLTGDGGDNLFTAPPTYLLNLVRSGRLLQVLTDAMDWSRLRKQNPRPLIVAALRRDAAYIGRNRRPRPTWLTADVPELPNTTDDANAVLAASVRTVARSANADVQLAAALGVPLHNPYFDGAVLDAVLSASPEQRCSIGRYKPLLADTFADVLPQAHRERPTKGVFVGDFHRGVRANLPRLLALADGRLAGMGLVDPGPLRAAMHAAGLGARTVWPPLLSAFAAECWLDAVGRAERIRWDASTGGGAR